MFKIFSFKSLKNKSSIAIITTILIIAGYLPISIYFLFTDMKSATIAQSEIITSHANKFENKIREGSDSNYPLNNIDQDFIDKNSRPGERVEIRTDDSFIIFDPLPHQRKMSTDMVNKNNKSLNPINHIDMKSPRNTSYLLNGFKFFQKDSVEKILEEENIISYLDEDNHFNIKKGHAFTVDVKGKPYPIKIYISKNIDYELSKSVFNFLNNLPYIIVWLMLIGIVSTIISTKMFFYPLRYSLREGFDDVVKSNFTKPMETKHKYGKEVNEAIDMINEVIDRMNIFVKINQDAMSTISHETKNHLAVVKTSVEIIEKINDVDHEMYKRKLESIKNHTNRIEQTMEAIRSLAVLKTSSATPVVDSHKISDLIDYLIQQKSRIFPETQFKLYYKSEEVKDIEIFVDPEHFYTGLAPIVRNAITYSTIRNLVCISICSADDELNITIKNYGSVIEQKDMPNIFLPYIRGTNVEKARKEGTGLGLSVSKKVMDIYNGGITVESSKAPTKWGGHTAFTLTFPLNKKI